MPNLSEMMSARRSAMTNSRVLRTSSRESEDMHLGFTSYVVGDTTTPAFGEKDLLIVASGSGSTSSVTNVAAKAKLLGGTLAVITTRADSALGRMADHLVEVPVLTDQVDGECMGRPLLPGGSLFEQATLLIGDAMCSPILSTCAFVSYWES